MSIASSLQSLDRASVRLERLGRIDQDFVRAVAAAVAERELTPLVREFLTLNLSASGLKTRTGKLAATVRRSLVRFRWRGKTPELLIQLPAGVGEYDAKGGGKGSNFYTVASSLHYGAVRAPSAARNVVDLPTGRSRTETRSVVGERAKRTIKSIALGRGASDRARSAIAKGRSLRKHPSQAAIIPGVTLGGATSGKGSVTLSSSAGSFVVIEDRPYYYLTETQRAMLMERFSAALEERLHEALNG